MVSVRQVSFAVISSLFICNAHADWNAGIEAGAQLGSDGSPTLRFFANNDSDPLSHYIYLDWIRTSGSSNFRLGYNPTFDISHSVYSFGRFFIEEDDPSGIEREIEALVGVGNNLFQRGNTRVKVEAGFGAKQLTFEEQEDEVDGFGFLSGRVSTSLLALLRFDASVSTRAGSDQTLIEAQAGISVPVGPGTSLRYVYSVRRFNFDERENIVDEDSFFTVSYGF